MEHFFLGLATLFVQIIFSAILNSVTGKFILFIFLTLTGFLIFKKRRSFKTKTREEDEDAMEDLAELEEAEKIMKKCKSHLSESLKQTEYLYTLGISSFLNEDLNALKTCINLKTEFFQSLDQFRTKVFRIASTFESSLHFGHYYVELKDYQMRMVNSVSLLLDPLYEHLDNSHKPFIATQKEELSRLEKEVSEFFNLSVSIVKQNHFIQMENLAQMHQKSIELLENMEVAQIKRIKSKQVNTRNSVLFLNTLSESKNMLNQTNSLIKAYQNLTSVLKSKN